MTTTKCHWYQFSLKTLMIVITVLCLGPGGYVAYEQEKAREQKAAVKAIEKVGGRFGYDRKTKPRSAAIRLLLGDETYGNVNMVALNGFDKPVADADLRHLKSLPNVKYLQLHRVQLSDAGLAHIAGLKKLKQLELSGLYLPPVTSITQTGVNELQKALPNCSIIFH